MNERMDGVRKRRSMWTRSAAVALFATMVIPSGALAGTNQLVVDIGDATGNPGGTAAVTVSLSGSQGNVTGVGLDVLFDSTRLSIGTENCSVASRISGTHAVSTFVPAEGRLRFLVADLTPPVATVSDGDLVTCTFQIAANAPLGGTELTPDLSAPQSEVVDNSVPPQSLDFTAEPGTITVEEEATPTPTNTNTVPPTATATRTNTVPPTVTATPTSTTPPTPTNTIGLPTATATRRPGGGGDGCAIVPSGGSIGSTGWVLLGLPLILLWVRRRAV